MHVFIESATPWLNEPLKGFIQHLVPPSTFHDNINAIPTNAETVFEICDGWALPQHFAAVTSAQNGLINAYPNNDALTRKSHLARVVGYWAAKRPQSLLKAHSPFTVCLSLDYAEYVDEALMAADDLSLLCSLGENEKRTPERREWWILKPALVDCGAGIRLFSTVGELAGHLELADDEVDEDEDEDEEQPAEQEIILYGNEGTADKESDKEKQQISPSLAMPGLSYLDGLITTVGSMNLDHNTSHPSVIRAEPKNRPYIPEQSHRIPSSEMREFVAQRYITDIALLEKRKWHVRAYVLSVGRLKVHVFREMLALLALEDYKPPWLNPSLKSSLTNTALQEEEDFTKRESMRDFWALPDDLFTSRAVTEENGDGEAAVWSYSWKERVFNQICDVSAEPFRAAAHTMADKFTALDKCFELFGVDFLIDKDGTAWLLEVNDSPAFYQQGIAGPLTLRLMESVILVTLEHMGLIQSSDEQNEDVRKRMVEVLDETDKLAKSNITEIMP